MQTNPMKVQDLAKLDELDYNISDAQGQPQLSEDNYVLDEEEASPKPIYEYEESQNILGDPDYANFQTDSFTGKQSFTLANVSRS